MDHSSLIIDLTLILFLASVATWICRSLRQPAILGYLLVGLLLSPHSFDLHVVDLPNIKIWAELGVILLMFSLGLEFSIRSFMSIGPVAVIIGCFGIAGMFNFGLIFNDIMNWSPANGWFLAVMVAISSTTIIVKIFSENSWINMRFAKTVIGILIVEDFVAILSIVALSSFGRQEAFDPVNLLIAAMQLLVVVSAWFIAGMFLVPRLMRSVGRHNSNELIVVSSVGLCLAMVWIAEKFNYSAALGAFIIGSILAESREVKRIENLISPVRDIFAAVFFVYIGMLLDPKIAMSQAGIVLAVSALILVGKPLSVLAGCLATGQTIENSFRIALSMSQIGEFSFVIGTLGLSMGIVEPTLVPIIVSACVVTTFISPFLMRHAETFGQWTAQRVPPGIVLIHNSYCTWMQTKLSNVRESSRISHELGRWSMSAVVVIAVFYIAKLSLPDILNSFLADQGIATKLVSWSIAFGISSPFLWSMMRVKVFTTFPLSKRRADLSERRVSVVGFGATVGLLAILSHDFVGWSGTSFIGLVIIVGLLVLSRRRLEIYYRWYEKKFLAGFEAGTKVRAEQLPMQTMFAPWDTVLSRVEILVGSPVAGSTLANLGLREKFGINIVAIERAHRIILPPSPFDTLLPGDQLLIFGEDGDLKSFEKMAAVDESNNGFAVEDFSAYRTSTITVSAASQWKDSTIRKARFREEYHCIVVGIERAGTRIKNPHSDTQLQSGDTVWLVGEINNLKRVTALAQG